jgi:hypothetical protein
MNKWFLSAAILLFPATVLTAGQDQNSPETQSALKSSNMSSTLETDGLDMNIFPDLQQIESFELKLGEDWQVESAPGDEETALIVNPFNVRKRGRYYGSVYEYHRNDNFDARNAFDLSDKPEYKRNQFGLSLGAFITNKLKVFGSYDGLRIIRGSTITSRVPTAEMKLGDFSNLPWINPLEEELLIYDPLTGIPFENNRIPESRIHPVAKNLLSLFPAPNVNGSGYNYVNSEPNIENNNTISSRIDYEFSSQTKIFGTYDISYGSRKRVAALPRFGTKTDEKEQDVSIDLTHSFSANKVLNLGVSFRRSVSLTLSEQSYQDGLLESVGIEGVQVLDSMDEGYPHMDILGYAGIGASSGFADFPGFSSGAPESFYENRYHIDLGYTYIHGNHTIDIGGELNFFQLNNMRTWGSRRGQFGFSGLFTRNLEPDHDLRTVTDAFADFLLGIPYTATRGIGSNRSDLRQRSWRLFIRDSWKINRNITFSMGLGYSYSPFFHSIHDNVSFFYPLVFEPPLDGEVIVTGSGRARELGLNLDPGHAAYDDKNDWQPNVGIAYSPFGNNRLVIRASYSIRNSPMNPMMALTYMGRNYPFFYLQSAVSSIQPDLDIGRPFESTALPALTFRAADPNLRNTFIQDREISLQYEFLPNWNLELTYEGRKSDRYFRAIPANVPLPGSGLIQPRRPNPEYGLFEILKSDASFSSNGLNARVTRRLTNIFSLRADFEWSRSISDAWGWAFANPNNPRDLSAERSVYGFRPMKTFGLNYILDLPIGKDKLLSSRWAGKFAQLFEGWRISGITSIEGGWPFSVEIFGDPNNDGVWGDRPNRIGTGAFSDSERSIGKWFETSDFEMPDYTGPDPQWFGNSGRNILMSPGSTKWDLSLLKRMRITESGNLLEFRVEFFNAFNHVNFDRPDNYINSPSFGQITGADPAREIEIALKYSF